MKYKDLIEAANYHYENRELDKALEYYSKALEKKQDVEVLSKVGLIYFGKGEYNKSFEMFSQALSINNEYANGYYGLAISSEELGRPQEAVEYYLEAVKYDPEYTTAYFFLANIYGDDREYEKAKFYYQKAISLDNQFTWAHINLGALYELEKNYDLALRHALIAYELEPNIKYVCFNLGVVYSKLGNYDLAEKFFLEEIEKSDGYIYAYLNLGILYKDYCKDLCRAKDTYTKGLKKDQTIANLWYNLACVSVLEGNYEDANQHFSKAFDHDDKLVLYFKKDLEVKKFKRSSFGKKLLGDKS